MSVTYRSFTLNDQITGISNAAVDTLLTANSGVAQISTATAYNSSASSIKLSIYILGAGIAATAVDPVWTQDIPATSAAIISGLIGHLVPNLGSLAAFAGTTNVLRMSVSGMEIVN